MRPCDQCRKRLRVREGLCQVCLDADLAERARLEAKDAVYGVVPRVEPSHYGRHGREGKGVSGPRIKLLGVAGRWGGWEE